MVSVRGAVKVLAFAAAMVMVATAAIILVCLWAERGLQRNQEMISQAKLPEELYRIKREVKEEMKQEVANTPENLLGRFFETYGMAVSEL